MVVVVEPVKELSVLAHQGHLGGGGAGVDTQIAVALVGSQIPGLYLVAVVALTEGVVVRLVHKEGLHPLYLKIHLNAVGKAVDEGSQLLGLLPVLGIQGGSHRGEQVGMFRGDNLVPGQVKGADKGLSQLRKEMKGSSQEGHVAPDGLAAGKAADGLIDHRLENGGGQILPGSSFVNQGLDVRLGEHAAAGGDGVDGLVIFGVLV